MNPSQTSENRPSDMGEKRFFNVPDSVSSSSVNGVVHTKRVLLTLAQARAQGLSWDEGEELPV